MAHTTIANLASWPIQVVLAALRDRQPARNSILTSALAMSDPRWAQRCVDDGAVTLEFPVLSPVPGGYTLQNPGTPPTPDNITARSQKAVALYREKAWGRDAFAVSQSGLDPLSVVADTLNNLRFDSWETTLIAQLKGIFLSSAFSGLSITTPNESPISSPGSNVLWDTDIFHDTIGILGMREDDLNGGIIVMHPKLRTFLKKADEIDYVKASSGTVTLETYKGLRIVVDDRLRRVVNTTGYVYTFYIMAPNTVVFSMAAQSADGTLSSSLAFDSDVPNLRKALYDRTVCMVHVNGTIWQPASADVPPTVATAGPTDTQLALANAWGCAYADKKNMRIVWGEVNI